jgi:TolB-like protein
MLLLFSAAWAATVAVLPLQQGAGGVAYEGLGRALAGMLTTDLSVAPGLTLVERAQLDALTTELALAESTFLDPATAQKLGKGLGAEFVVVGGYSVVGETFLLDARLVKVETGAIVRAADANGTVAAFVDVEKQLVTGLLEGLEVKLAEDARARILAAAPTRTFDAFAAYGEGLARESAGKLPEAQAAYGEALAADPDFALAADSLLGLRSALDAAAHARQRKQSAKRAEKLDALLVSLPEPSKAPDRKARAAFLLRLLVLHEQGRDCQRYAEMRRYLDVTGWKFATSKDGYAQLWKDATALAVELGYAPDPAIDAGGHRDVEFRIQSRGASLFSSVGRWFYDFPTMLVDVPTSSDMVTALTKCMSVPEALRELEALRAAAEKNGVGGERVFDYPVPLSERLEWSTLSVRARSTGIDATMSARIGALVAAYDDETPLKPTGGGTARAWVEGQARQLAVFGVAVERARVARLGFSDATLRAALDAVGSGDPARVAADDPDCITPLGSFKAFAAATKGSPPYAAVSIAPLRDMGCLVGIPGRFANAAEAVRWVQTAPSRGRDTESAGCVAGFTDLPTRLPPEGSEVPSFMVHTMLSWYYSSLVLPLCVSDPAVGAG